MRRLKRFLHVLSEEERVFWEDRRFWFGVVAGALFVGLMWEVFR